MARGALAGRRVGVSARWLIPSIWLCWALYWWYASRAVHPDQWRESRRSRLLHSLPLMLAFVLLSTSRGPGEGAVPGVEFASHSLAVGAALTAVGLGFAVWARRHLGHNWSGTVTIKVNHELVTSGPYRIARHPIYTGMLLAFVGSAIAVDAPRGWLAVLLAGVAIRRKVTLEEREMRERFGAAYERYAQRVAAVLPLLW